MGLSTPAPHLYWPRVAIKKIAPSSGSKWLGQRSDLAKRLKAVNWGLCKSPIRKQKLSDLDFIILRG